MSTAWKTDIRRQTCLTGVQHDLKNTICATSYRSYALPHMLFVAFSTSNELQCLWLVNKYRCFPEALLVFTLMRDRNWSAMLLFHNVKSGWRAWYWRKHRHSCWSIFAGMWMWMWIQEDVEEQERSQWKNKNAPSTQAGQADMLVLQIYHFLSAIFFCNYGLLVNLSSMRETRHWYWIPHAHQVKIFKSKYLNVCVPWF